MPTRLLLDGDDLAALMQRVRAEMGPTAVVVRAERVRTGGVAGFFAKEHFELTVEVPEPPPRTPRRPRDPRPVGMAGLLDAADAAEAHDAARSAGGEHLPAVGADAGASAVRPTGAGSSGQAAGSPGESLGSPGQKGASSGQATVPSGRVVDPAAAEVAAPVGPRVSTDDATFASLLASIDVMAGSSPRSATPNPMPVAVPPTAESPPAVLVAPVLLNARFAPAEPERLPGSSVTRRATASSSARTAGGNRRALLGLGIPAALLGSGAMDEVSPLSDLLAQLVRPPVLLRTPGSIVAVVGESTQALAVATQLAVRVRQDPHDVVLAGVMHAVVGHARRLLSPSAAAMHRARIADGERVSIVAIGVGPETEDWPVAAELLADLGPDQAWAVVDARRKTSDLRCWLRTVGAARDFDVVAAASVHETQEPGTVLDLGLPIGWIDGLPATPVVWAAVLSERLDAGARWD